MEWLKKLLENATITENKLDIESLMKSINKEFPKQAISKVEYDNIESQLTTANKTIKDLKKNNSDNEDLQQTINTHEKTITDLKENHKKEISTLKKTSAINSLLLTNKAKYPELLKDKFDLEKVKIKDDGSVDQEGLTEQLTSIKESYKDMFSEEGNPGDNTPTYKYIPGDGSGGDDSNNNASGFVGIIKSNQSRR